MNLSLLPVLFTSIATGLCFAYRGAVSPWTTRRNSILNPMVTRASRHEFSTHRECQYSAKPSITLDHLSLPVVRNTQVAVTRSYCHPWLMSSIRDCQFRQLCLLLTPNTLIVLSAYIGYLSRTPGPGTCRMLSPCTACCDCLDSELKVDTTNHGLVVDCRISHRWSG